MSIGVIHRSQSRELEGDEKNQVLDDLGLSRGHRVFEYDDGLHSIYAPRLNPVLVDKVQNAPIIIWGQKTLGGQHVAV